MITALRSVFRVAALAVAVLLAGMFVTDASSQSLPDWAAPSGGGVATAPQSDARVGNHVPPPPEVPPQVPIDGGLSLLALAGGAYAVRRLRKRGKERDETEG